MVWRDPAPYLDVERSGVGGVEEGQSRGVPVGGGVEHLPVGAGGILVADVSLLCEV